MPAPLTVSGLITGFLADADGRVKPNTLATYQGLLTPFSRLHGATQAAELTAATSEAYARRPGWSLSMRHNFLGALATAFRFAVRSKLLRENPLTGLRRPPKASRGSKAVVPPEDFARLLEAATPALRSLLKLLHETGARPSELSHLEAIDIDFVNAVAVLADHKTAHATGRPRVIILTAAAVELLREMSERYPVGPLLRNSKGRPWTKDGIGLAVRRCREKAGVKAIAYGLRHTFATEALANGVPDAHVAELLGHAGTTMLHKHYSHLGSKARALRESLGRVRG
jgi:integrase